MSSHHKPDVVIIGGGAAGSSAALVLGRARFDVLLIDVGEPSNAPSTGIGGLLGHDGADPADFYRKTREELASYPTIQRLDRTATALRPGGTSRWTVQTADGDIGSDRILLAMGMHYQLPDIDGVGPRWGSSVFHCPFCHGWEHRDQPLAVLGGPPERALLLRQWTDDLTLITNHEEIGSTSVTQLNDAGIKIVNSSIRKLEGPGDKLERVHLDNGNTLSVTGLMVSAPHQQRRPSILDHIDLEITETGHVVTDDFGATNVPGLWAAGDVSHPMASVAHSIAAGSAAAMAITRDLLVHLR